MVLGDFNAKQSAWYDRQGTDAQGAALKLLTDSDGLHQIIASSHGDSARHTNVCIAGGRPATNSSHFATCGALNFC